MTTTTRTLPRGATAIMDGDDDGPGLRVSPATPRSAAGPDASAHQRPQEAQGRPSGRRRPAGAVQRLRQVIESTGSGFLYGSLFGSVMGTIEGYRSSPQGQRLRGILHHNKAVVPETAGRIAVISCVFQVAAWGLDGLNRHETPTLATVLLAAPLAGAALRIRQGPRAMAHSAVTFGTVGAVMVAFNVLEARVRHHGRDPPNEVLEEIAFAEELDEWE